MFECNLLDFIGVNIVELEVLAAKTHGENYDCGLFDYAALVLEKLDIHLKMCEISVEKIIAVTKHYCSYQTFRQPIWGLTFKIKGEKNELYCRQFNSKANQNYLQKEIYCKFNPRYF